MSDFGGACGADIAPSIRRKMATLVDDLKEIRDQGRLAALNAGDLPLFKGMCRALSSIYRNFQTLFDELSDLVNEDQSLVLQASDRAMRADAKRYFYDVNSMLESHECHRRTVVDPSSLGNSSLGSVGGRAKAKLPTLRLPPFDGSRTEWPRFRDTFESLIIHDTDLRDIDRFHYLVASLKGAASAVIANVPLNEENFQIAWRSLKSTYDNKRLLATAYLDKLLELTPFTKRPSVELLTETIAKLSETVAAFKLLRIPNEKDFIFFHLSRKCLDRHTREAFEISNSVEFPTFENLIDFLRARCTASELASGLIGSSGSNRPIEGFMEASPTSPRLRRKHYNYTKPVLYAHMSTECDESKSRSDVYPNIPGSSSQNASKPRGHVTCYICQGPHLIVNCLKYANSSVDERIALLRSWRGCRNCLLEGHSTKRCASKFRCRICRKPHHSTLHLTTSYPSKCAIHTSKRYGNHTNQAYKAADGPSTSKEKSASVSLNTVAPQDIEVILGTALCHIDSDAGLPQSVRLAVDSGSHFSFITSECVKRLKLSVKPVATNIRGVGETPLKGFKGRVSCTLSPREDSSLKIYTSAIVLDAITAPLPGFDTPKALWKDYMQYPLADPTFWETRPIDFLLGCGPLNEVLIGPIVTVSPNLPKLVGTVFGHIVVGRVPDLSNIARGSVLHTKHDKSMSDLQAGLQRFWEIEEPLAAKDENPEDAQCEDFFKRTFFRMSSGRYGIRMPFKVNNVRLGESYGQALRRLAHLEGRLEKNSSLRDKYNNFMAEYLELGHMNPASRPGKFYIPHHCVLKGEGNDSKIRVVFDAAARTSQGSLNESLMVGPKLQKDITQILLSFRRHQYAFVADAEKMYRQILMFYEDRVFQHILWRFSPSDAVQEYELNTLTYGLSSAPYQALRVIQQLILDHGAEYPLAAQALSDDIYIDDIVTGSSSLPEAIELQRQVIALMAAGEFTLGKWAANHPDLIPPSTKTVEQAGVPADPVAMDGDHADSSVKVLGLQWCPPTDTFAYSITPPSKVYTKRSVLSTVAKIYDPLGYLGPSVLIAKLIVQEAWKRKLEWDALFPNDMEEEWTKFIDELPWLSKVHLPRWITPLNERCQILIFADASERAYCATAYIRFGSVIGTEVHLLLAKIKLAPVKVTTIPRLELCAALLAARLWQTLQPFCSKLEEYPEPYFFSDSTIVLAWLKTPSYKLKTFVANRVVTIRDITASHTWRHVASGDNPSDIGSRGITPLLLPENILWFHGPQWALWEPSEWPNTSVSSPATVPELRFTASGQALISAPTPSSFISWVGEKSSFPHLIRSFSYILRFINNVRYPSSRLSGPLNLEELRKSGQTLVRVVQAHAFFHDKFPTAKTLPPKHLAVLNPFINESGLLLVGGRLKHACLPWSTRHPILLPAKSPFSRLLVSYYHRILLHPGPTALLAHLRSKYWIVGARNLIRQVCRGCITCQKLNSPVCQPLMGNLPPVRFREGRAFLNVGVDYAGPFFVRDSLKRKAGSSKAYLSIFICLSTRALHLELVSSLSTPAFCAALERFIGRRGLPECVYSDNGTNFVGASNELKDLYSWIRQRSCQEEILTYTTLKEIEWHWSPPHAPEFGGSWERGVRSIKRLLRTVYGENQQTFEELTTLLVRIEAMLNSRPLCPLSSDPKDLDCLTPGHFLIGAPLLSVPEKSVEGVKENRLSRWELIRQKSQHFWNRWRGEYLTGLQERHKWQKPGYNFQVGDLVLLKEENAPRLHWPTGRVVEIHPGKDNVVRVVTVKTPSSVLKRPSNKLVPLFVDTPDFLCGKDKCQPEIQTN